LDKFFVDQCYTPLRYSKMPVVGPYFETAQSIPQLFTPTNVCFNLISLSVPRHHRFCIFNQIS